MASPFDPFRLSKDPWFRKLTPELASKYATAIRDLIEQFRPDLEAKGMYGPAMGMLDMPLDAAGIQDFRANERKARRTPGLVEKVESLGMASVFPAIGEHLTRTNEGIANMLGSFWGERIPPLPEETVNLPVLGEQDPLALVSEIASSLLPFMGATRAVRGLGLAKTALAGAPKLAGAVEFGLTGAGLQSAREVGELATQGTAPNPLDVLREGLIFGAGGAPVGRVKGAGLVGLTATGATAMGGDVDPNRVLAEMLFTGVMGTPGVTPKVTPEVPVPKPKSVPLPQPNPPTPGPLIGVPKEPITNIKPIVPLFDDFKPFRSLKADPLFAADTAIRKTLRGLRFTQAEQENVLSQVARTGRDRMKYWADLNRPGTLAYNEAIASFKGMKETVLKDVDDLVYRVVAPEQYEIFDKMRGEMAKLEAVPEEVGVQYRGLQEAMDDLIAQRVPQIMADDLTARRMVDDLIEGRSASEAKFVLDRLPAPFAPFKKKAADLVADLRQERPVHPDEKLLPKLREYGLHDMDEILPNLKEQIAKVKTTRGLQMMAARFGVQLSAKAGKLEGVFRGASQEFADLDAMKKFFNGILDGNVQTFQQLDVAAGQKGLLVQHLGKGRFKARNPVTNEEFSGSFEEVAKRITEAVEPGAGDIAAPGIVAPVAAALGDFGGMERLPWSPVAPGGIQLQLGMMKNLLLNFQEALQEPLYDYWVKVEDAVRTRRAMELRWTDQLRGAFKGVKRTRYNAIQDYFLAGEAAPEMRRRLEITDAEAAASKKLGEFYKGLMAIDDAGLDELRSGIGELRNAQGDPTRVTLPGALAPLVEEIYEGRIRLDTRNALTMAADTLSLHSRNILKPLIKEGRKIAGKLRHGKTGEMERDYVNAYTTLTHYLDAVENRTSDSARQVADTLTSFSGILKKLGMIDGTELTAQDVERLASMSTSWYSGLAMSARTGLALRNLFQVTLLGPKVGNTVMLRALARATSAAGRKEFANSNIMTDPRIFALDEARLNDLIFTAQKGLPQALGKAEYAARELQRYGMWGYRKADTLTRSTAYFAGKIAIEDNLHFLKKGDVDSFLLWTGLAGDSPVIQRRILSKLSNRTPIEMAAAADDAGRAYGTHLIEDTQFLYSGANAPALMQNVYGRMFGQFGVWNVGFAEYMARNLGLSRGLIGPGGFNSLTTRYRAMFLGRYGGQIIALGLLGMATGIDTSSWNRSNPLAFEGGPALQVARDLVTVGLGTGTPMRRELALRNTKRFMSEMANPFAAAFKDVQEAWQEEDPYRAMLLLLGFNMKKKEPDALSLTPLSDSDW